MSFEIELKAHVDDCVPVEERLSALGTYYRSYTKSDSYWFPAQGANGGASALASGVRVRRENAVDANGTVHESVLVTCKHKVISGGIEVNDEREFTVSDAVLFEELLECLGLRKAVCKEKRGRAWTIQRQRSIVAELSLVAGLGWFLELEIIADDNDRQTIAESRKQLLALLETLQIPAEKIEAMPYTEMLKKATVTF